MTLSERLARTPHMRTSTVVYLIRKDEKTEQLWNEVVGSKLEAALAAELSRYANTLSDATAGLAL